MSPDLSEWSRFDRLKREVRAALANALYPWAIDVVAETRFSAMTTEQAVAFIEAHDRAFAARHGIGERHEGEANTGPVQA
jgi:hypothetical protein